MNIVLINPPFTYFPGNSAEKYNYCRPPLGICYLASYLKKYGDQRHNIRILDMLAAHHTMKEWEKKVAACRPDVLGFSVVTPTANIVCRMADNLRKACPDARFVVGGPHATVRPEDLVEDFDAVVVGEGEATFLELIRHFQKNKPFHDIPGVVSSQDGELHRAPARKLITPLDNIPPPDRSLLSIHDYYHTLPYSRGIFTTMFTTRGCPNDCYFCANRSLWNRILRYHSMDYVARELELLVNEMGIAQIFIDDDDFLSNKKRAMQICEHMIREKLDFKWICHSCASSIDEQSLKVMKRAGCVEIQIGVESGDAGVLKSIPKCASLAEIENTFKMVHRHDINTWATFILGHPGDTRKSINNTIRFAKKIDATYTSFIFLLPFPGSRAFDQYQRLGYLKTTNWDDYSWHGDPVFETPHLSRRELVRLRSRAMTSFYLRPRKIASYVKQMLKTGSARELLRDFFSWLSLAHPKSRV